MKRGPLVGRRGVMLALMLAMPGLGGCGFHPLYASNADGTAGPAAAGLAAINIGLIPERSGQLLRQALQERFERNGLAEARRYDLNVSFSVAGAAIAIQPDSSNAYNRLVGTASYQLIAQDPNRTVLTTGTARAVDGLQVFDQQLFAMQLETEAVTQRVAQAVADEITQQLAAYFDKQAALAAR